MAIKAEALKEYIQQGREIEFSFEGKNYFLYPDYKKQAFFYVQVEDENNKENDGWTEKFHGSYEDFMLFKFEKSYSFEEILNKMKIQCVL